MCSPLLMYGAWMSSKTKPSLDESFAGSGGVSLDGNAGIGFKMLAIPQPATAR